MKEKIKILIADDHPLMLQGLEMVLTEAENTFLCDKAKDGQEAFNKLIENNYDLAILDVEMPILSGLEIVRKCSGKNIETNFIFLTMYKEEDMFNEAMDIGAKGYVLKENAVTDIVNCISEVQNDKYYISPLIADYLENRLNRKKNTSSPSINDLTKTERKILKLISQDKTSRLIAEELFVSVKTVENHRNNISKKLNLQGSHSLVKYAIQNKNLL
ncbi:MAG: response regulator transcription factor [Ignavibacteriales bacterium]|nr:response regulator transcription factor [Ignavibacteriales bacterium]